MIKTCLIPTWYGSDDYSSDFILEYRLVSVNVDRRTKIGKFLHGYIIPDRNTLEALYYFQFCKQKPFHYDRNATTIIPATPEIADRFQKELISAFGNQYKHVNKKFLVI